MKNTLLPSAAVSGVCAASGITAGSLAMERQSVTAPDYRSSHSTALPFSGMTLAARTNAAQDADVPGSPPRGGPV